MLEKIEKWEPIKGYEGAYEVSSYGRVKSLDRLTHWGKGKNREHIGRILLPNYHNGYAFVRLCKGGETHSYKVHRLVAIAFIENKHGKQQVNHLDLNRANNHVDNLEWVTAKENKNHGVINRKPNMPFGEKSKRSKLSNLQRIEIYKAWEGGAIKRRLAIKYMVDPKVISQITKKAYGYFEALLIQSNGK